MHIGVDGRKRGVTGRKRGILGGRLHRLGRAAHCTTRDGAWRGARRTACTPNTILGPNIYTISRTLIVHLRKTKTTICTPIYRRSDPSFSCGVRCTVPSCPFRNRWRTALVSASHQQTGYVPLGRTQSGARLGETYSHAADTSQASN